PFIPQNLISAPKGTTHFKIFSVAAEINFDGGTFVVDSTESSIMPLDNILSTVVQHENTITSESEHPLFCVIGIEFYQEINQEMYPLRNGAFNSIAIVKVDGGV